jgi:hypothetical protein
MPAFQPSDPLGHKAGWAHISNGYKFPSARRGFFDPAEAKDYFARYFPDMGTDPVSVTKQKVAEMQRQLGVRPDGVFGRKTYTATTLSELDFQLNTTGALGAGGDYGKFDQGIRALLGAHDQSRPLADAVRAFQQTQGIEPTGIVDGNTLNGMYRMHSSAFADPTKVLNERQVNQFLRSADATPAATPVDAGTANRTWVNPDTVAAGVDNGMGNRWVNPDAVPARHPQIKPT